MKIADKQNIIREMRAFNRFYTRLIGLLDGQLLHSEYSLAEARILYEIHAARQISASQIVSLLNIDKGYLSRILKKLEKNSLICKERSAGDGRISVIVLTEKGAEVFNELNDASDRQIDTLMGPLSVENQQKITGHMAAIMRLLDSRQ